MHGRVKPPAARLLQRPDSAIELAAAQTPFLPLVPLVAAGTRSTRRRLYLLLLAVDILSIYCCFAFGALVKFGGFDEQTWLRVSLAATPLFLGIAAHNGAYSHEALRSPSTSAANAVGALVTAFALLFFVSYFLKAEQDVSRLSIALGGLGAIVAMATFRKVIGDWITRRFRGHLTSTVIIADETCVQAPDGAVVIDPRKYGLDPDSRNPDMLQRFAQLIEGADRVVVACQREVCAKWAMLLKGANVCGEILADEVQSVGAVAVSSLGARTTLVVSTGPLSLQQQIIKRVFDLCLAVPLLVFLAPVLLGVALAIRLDSSGPVLFRQPRVGFGNKLFNVYKFRSMTVASCDVRGDCSTLPGDARITRIGRFIRSTSIDELPQLFNVLGGTMSLVGPRPHAIGSLAGALPFWDVDHRYPHRHMLKPGITGLAQVRGQRGTVHHADDITQRLQSDLEYMTGWTIWRDVMILLKTARVMVHQNAY